MKNNKVKIFRKENPKSTRGFVADANKKSIKLTRKDYNLLKEVLL